MALETVTHISDLIASNPVAGDDVSEGDDHIRNIKTALKTDFPNIDSPVTATPAELNRCDITTLGTITANEVVTADGSGNINCNNSNFTNVDIDSGTIAGAVTGVTQSSNDNSTKLATTAYADNAAGLNNVFVNDSYYPLMLSGGSTSGYDVSTETQNAWHTFGAIGSGADVEDATFADLTATHDWVELKILLYGIKSGNNLDLRLYGGDDGVSVTPSSYEFTIAQYSTTVAGATNLSCYNFYTAKVPASNGRFSLRWTDNAASGRQFNVWVTGVGVNGS